MLYSFNELKQFAIRATDQLKGNVDDFYFDDESWTIRYLVAQTGSLLSGRQVLVGADLLEKPDIDRSDFPVAVSAKDLEDGITPDQVSPVSRQRKQQPENAALPYWPSFLVGMHSALYTPLLAEQQLLDARRGMAPERRETAETPENSGDPHLRSMHEVRRYSLLASDEKVGSVSDFLVDPRDWTVRYVVVDAGNWFSGNRVVLTTKHVVGINAEAQTLTVDLSRAEIKEAPPVASLDELKHSTAHEIVQKYGAMGYWPGGL